MKSEVIYIGGVFVGKLFFNLGTVCEVLLYECSLPDQDAALIPYNDIENIGSLILKKGDIKAVLHDAESSLVKFVLTKPMEVTNINCQTLAFEILKGVTIEENAKKIVAILN